MTQSQKLRVQHRELMARADELQTSVPGQPLNVFGRPDRGENQTRTKDDLATSAQWHAYVEQLNRMAFKKFGSPTRSGGVRLKRNQLGPNYQQAIPATIGGKQ